MRLGTGIRERLVAIVAACAVCLPTAQASDDLAMWLSTLRSGGMQPAEDAVTALAKVGEPAVAPLARLLVAGTPLERRRACAALGGMSTSVATVVEPLVKASTDPDVEVRLAAVEGLGQRAAASDPARDALRRALADHDPNVRVRAAASLASSNATDARAAEPVLLAALRDEPLAARVAALGGLARLGESASGDAPAAVKAALGDHLAPVRGAAVVALAALRPALPDTVAALCPRLGDPDAWVAMGTARTLATLEAPVASCGAGFLASTERATARRAAWLLLARAPRERAAAEAIAARASDGDPVVASYARSAAWWLGSRAGADE